MNGCGCGRTNGKRSPRQFRPQSPVYGTYINQGCGMTNGTKSPRRLKYTGPFEPQSLEDCPLGTSFRRPYYRSDGTYVRGTCVNIRFPFLN